MQLTEKEALEKSRKMWQWLADNPSKHKSDYFKSHGIKRKPLLHCYFCERCLVNCNCCLGKKLWGEKQHCFDNGNIYTKWKHNADRNKHDNAKKYAQQIADFCQQELDKLSQ